ncbi:MAG: hypothetical protein Pg6C_00510 [Treponemataceae bacterium]|nr:MAG: hypothetical protein Pg6C_00510 [Treponemataceae bacterium]
MSGNQLLGAGFLASILGRPRVTSRLKRNSRKKVNFFRDYFSAVSAFFLGRPLPGTLQIILKSSLVYKASCENGLRPARSSRFLTVAVGIFNNVAISLTVIPCIFLSIDKFIKKVNIKRHFTIQRISEICNFFFKICLFFRDIYIENMSFLRDNIT